MDLRHLFLKVREYIILCIIVLAFFLFFARVYAYFYLITV